MRLLVVDDDAKVAGFLEQGLLEEGFDVHRAADGEQAIAQASTVTEDPAWVSPSRPRLRSCTMEPSEPNGVGSEASEFG